MAQTKLLRCNQGINQQIDEASDQQCADASNVWAPAGRVEERPGFLGLTTVLPSPIAGADFALISEIGGAFTTADPLTLTGLGQTDHWYMGSAVKTTGGFILTGFSLDVTVANTNTLGFYTSYWNGTEWAFLPTVDYTDYIAASRTAITPHLSSAAAHYFIFVPPADWTASSIAGSADRYFLRFSLVGSGTVSAGTTVSTAGPAGAYLVAPESPAHGLFAFQFLSTKRYVSLFGSATASLTIFNFPTLVPAADPGYLAQPGFAPQVEPATAALVPQFNEAFVAYGHTITRHGITATDGDNYVAKVEVADWAVGPGAEYDRETIAQLAEFPRAKFISFFGNRLWAANFESEPFTVRWSAPAPYHRVWPALAYEYLMENDNSPITAMAPLGESMIVYKRDSIWKLIFNEIDEFGVPHFTPTQIIRGKGCVAAGSLQEVRGRHIFLSEDGIYAFDGTPNIVKVTEWAHTTARVDRLAETMAAVVPGVAPLAASVHWKSKKLYLLSLATGVQTTNATTLVWEYERDVWWIWDGFNAQFWLLDEGQNDEEILYFVTSTNQIYQFGVGNHDHGAAINSYIETQLLGRFDGKRKAVEEVELTSTNTADSMTVMVYPNGGATAASSTYSTSDAAEPKLGSFTLDTSKLGMKIVRAVSRDWNVSCNHFKIRVTGGGRGKPFALSMLRAVWHSLYKR